MKTEQELPPRQDALEQVLAAARLVQLARMYQDHEREERVALNALEIAIWAFIDADAATEAT